MSKLLEIFGRAITVNTADLIWHWLNAVTKKQIDPAIEQINELEEIIDILGNLDIEKADEKLRFYLFENPECVKGRMTAVAICLHKNAIEEALEQLQSIYLRQPSNTMALYALGYCYERLAKEPQAIEFYQDCLKFKNHLQLPRQRLAAIYFKDGRVDKTTKEYEMLTTEHPEDILSLVTLGYLYIYDEKYEQAVDTLNMAIVAHPDNFHDDEQASQIQQLLDEGQFDQAIEQVQWLIDQVGETPDLDVRMADIHSRSGRAAEAITHYEKAIRNQPNYLEATIKLGTHYLRLQRPSLAAEQFNRAVEINDEIVDAYVGLALAQSLAGDHHDAAGTLSLASAIQQNSTLLFSETASLHFQAALGEQNDLTKIVENPKAIIEEVIKAHHLQLMNAPTNADVHYKYGILMMVVEKLDSAIESFKNALEINPTHHRATSKLALCLYETGKTEDAIKQISRTNTLDTATLQLHYQTAILYCDKHKFAEALCALENTMKDNFTQSDAIVNIEVVLENLGLVDRAIATWDRLNETAHNALGARFE